jgi:hypothetical protein
VTATRRRSARSNFVVGRAAYEQVAAVEGLTPGPKTRSMFARLDRENASPVERLVTIITANSSPKAWHVVPHRGGWAVRSSGAADVTATYASQGEAVARAEKAARAMLGELLIHGRDGRLLRRLIYAKAPEGAKG